ncbi:hypothetical protein EJ05DRAFT_501286 [Pseudovirgaria hyperparasitica]|uniref:Uncharacterized protein n=1 Tax=Pseudovirgaria hyperparasitica TaxID=470096 RepID=A0A6A6W6V8_9PEZI|nr:uncharacterized protein EJ05DRAFT_501286 [Pseudovirgaria hyperparasitica]KAF2757764.1 hypothetical protein EJ05DRAFT_501286 [Pseudovirgaria hyperparasitica]
MLHARTQPSAPVLPAQWVQVTRDLEWEPEYPRIESLLLKNSSFTNNLLATSCCFAANVPVPRRSKAISRIGKPRAVLTVTVWTCGNHISSYTHSWFMSITEKIFELSSGCSSKTRLTTRPTMSRTDTAPLRAEYAIGTHHAGSAHYEGCLADSGIPSGKDKAQLGCQLVAFRVMQFFTLAGRLSVPSFLPIVSYPEKPTVAEL